MVKIHNLSLSNFERILGDPNPKFTSVVSKYIEFVFGVVKKQYGPQKITWPGVIKAKQPNKITKRSYLPYPSTKSN